MSSLVPLSPVVTPSEASRMVARTSAVDAVGLEERAASLATRSIKRDAKRWALELAIRCTDLTTLEGSDTVGKIVAMCSKAVRPRSARPDGPPGGGGVHLPVARSDRGHPARGYDGPCGR